MTRISLVLAAIGISASVSFAQPASSGPYRVLRTAKVGGTGGFDYVYADAAGGGSTSPAAARAHARSPVFNLDTLEPAGEIPNTNARGAAVDPKSGHGFSSSKPVAMWDTKTLAVIKTIDVQGNPDGILFDPFNAARLGVQPQRAERDRHRRQGRHRSSARSIWAARRSRRSPMATATSTSTSKTRTTSPSSMPRR